MATFGTFTSGQVLTASELNTGLPACFLSVSGYSTLHNTDNYIAFTSEDYDPLGWHSTSTNPSRITPNVAGWYWCAGQVNNLNPSGANFRGFAGIRKNRSSAGFDNQFARFDINNYCPDDFSIGGVIYLNGTTDYVELDVAQFSGVTKTTNNTFTVMRVSG